MTEPAPPPEAAPDPAKRRFIVMQAVRLAGVVTVLAGMLIATGKLPVVPRLAGFLIMVVGFLDMAVMPLVLARRWRTPKP